MKSTEFQSIPPPPPPYLQIKYWLIEIFPLNYVDNAIFTTRKNSPSYKNKRFYLNTNPDLHEKNFYSPKASSPAALTSSTSSTPSLQKKQSPIFDNSPIIIDHNHKSIRDLKCTTENRRKEYRSPANIHHRSTGIHDFIHLSLPVSEPIFTSDESYSSSSLPVTPLSTTICTTERYRPNLNNILRTSSFDSRFTNELNDDNNIHSNYPLKANLYEQTELKSLCKHMANCNNTDNENPNKSHSITSVIKRSCLTITPSIEISLVNDEHVNNDVDNNNNNNNNNNNSNNNNECNVCKRQDKFVSELPLYPKTPRDRLKSNRLLTHNNRSTSLHIDVNKSNDNNDVFYQHYLDDNNSVNRIRARALSSQQLHTQNNLDVTLETNKYNLADTSSCSYSSSSNRRGKLVRQSRSFQNPVDPINNNNNNIDCSSTTALYNQNKPDHVNTSTIGNVMDEFDYFCHIANVPRDQEKKRSTIKTSLHPTLSSSNIRSHSMRETSLERQKCIIDYGTNNSGSISDTKSIKSNKISYLKPPGKGQLRRASTEEDPLNKSSLYKRPVAATLSYTSMTNSYSNLCLTPPKSIPSVPYAMEDIDNPTSPLGVPLSLDSVFADEPGLTFYQVQVLGVSGVGKTSLCQQLAALVHENSPSCDPDETDNKLDVYSITTALWGSVYTVNFVDTSAEDFEKNLEVQIRDCIDAFLVVYAIDDQNSFEAARLIVNALTPLNDTRQCPTLPSPKAMNSPMTAVPGLIYLVGNKSDLVRGRQVSTDEGRHLASIHGAKFIEVSASLNHMVADLFVLLIGHLHESEQRGRDPRLPAERRVNPLQSNPLTSSSKSITNSNVVNTFKILTVTKANFSKFLKKHFKRVSQVNDQLC
ncbi:unnamed protein product [Schistosoma spindalis]|nr:unnamed protein product [Schistosoma spindale]